MATAEWLLGALVGAAATYAGTEVHVWRRQRRTLDGAAIDLARQVLEEIPDVKRELERADDYKSYLDTLGDVVTAQLRDKVGRLVDHLETRVRDAELTASVREVHSELIEARKAAREFDAAPSTDHERHWEDSSDAERTEAFARVYEHVMSAANSTDTALARIADLERSRPRR